MAKLLSTIIDGFISSRKFLSGFAGEGWRIGKRGNSYVLEVDDLVVRKTMHVFELLISKIRAVKGALSITQASGKVSVVREEGDYYVLTLEEENSFLVNDLVRCQTFGTVARYYWVEIGLIREVGDSGSEGVTEILIRKSEFVEGMSLPQEGDELVQFGNTTDTGRQAAIYLSADSNGLPAIDVLQGICSKSFEGCTKVRLGGLGGVVDGDFPEEFKDYGIYCENGYFKGTITGAGGYLLRSDGTGYICNGAIWWDEQKKVHFDGEVVLKWENMPPDAQELLKGAKGDTGEKGEKGEDANLLPWVEEWNNNKTVIGGNSLISPKIFSGKREADESLTGVVIGSEVVEIDGEKKTGVFGLKKGNVTFAIDAETGDTMYRGSLNVNNGQFMVSDDGSLVARNANISGKITSNEGIIGGFEIRNSGIGKEIKDCDSDDHGMSLTQNYIRFRSPSGFAAIGNNVLAPSTGFRALLTLQNKEINTQGINYGAIINVTNANKNIALDITNGDIILKNGVFQNLCLGIKVLSDTYKIPDDETYTIYMNGANKKVDLILPDNPPVGKVIMARVWGSHEMGIVAPANAKVVVRDDTQWTQIKANSGGTFGSLSIVYFGDRWTDRVKRWFVFEGLGDFAQGNG